MLAHGISTCSVIWSLQWIFHAGATLNSVVFILGGRGGFVVRKSSGESLLLVVYVRGWRIMGPIILGGTESQMKGLMRRLGMQD